MPTETWNTILTVVLLSVMGSVAWLWRLVIDNSKQIGAINSALDLPGMKRDLDAIHSRITKLNGEFSRVEGKLKAIDISRLSESVNKVAGQINALDGQVQMITQHLLDNK